VRNLPEKLIKNSYIFTHSSGANGPNNRVPARQMPAILQFSLGIFIDCASIQCGNRSGSQGVRSWSAMRLSQR